MKFDNTLKAYKLKSNKDLYRAFLIFKIISSNIVVSFASRFLLVMLKLKIPVHGILKNTIFKQFCAGLKKKDSMLVVEKLNKSNIKSYMHFAVEGYKSEADIEINLNNILETISFSKKSEALPFTVFKATSLGAFSLFEKKNSKILLNPKDSKTWSLTLNRIQKCCLYAKKINVRILIDAEESWVQDSIDEIAEGLMQKYNQKQVLIFTTIQMYRKDRLEYLKNLIKKAQKNNFKIGIKLVRGAYIEKENNYYKSKGAESPICETKEATDNNFFAALDYILPRISRCNLFLGSHNESSVIKVIEWMKKNKLPNNFDKIWFSQLYGMADHISFNLASDGYQVVKYVPYGPVNKVIPYLIRRAEENTSIKGQIPKELYLIKNELKRRKS